MPLQSERGENSPKQIPINIISFVRKAFSDMLDAKISSPNQRLNIVGAARMRYIRR